MFLILIMTWLFPLSVFSQTAPLPLGRIESFSSFSQYLKTQSAGVVRPVKDTSLQFKINHITNQATAVLSVPNPNFIHSLFETDVIQMIKNQGTTDFVSAKRKFYSALAFNSVTQRYARPYVYPTDWKSLNHNPIRKINLPHEVYGEQFRAMDSKTIEQSPLLDIGFQHKLDDVTATQLTAGNKLRLLSNGEVSFKEKVRMVKSAKYFFHAIVMVQYCDESSNEIVDAMIERAQAGVDVRLIMEKAWTELILQKCLNKLQRGGVKVTLGKGFYDPRTMFTVHHTKFWIRDGEEAIMGGQNMHDFENSSNGFNNHTRDKDVHVTGPAVTDMLREYVVLWNHEQEKPDEAMATYQQMVVKKEALERSRGLRGQQHYQQWLEQNDVKDIPGVCRVLVQGSKTSPNPNIISKAYIEIMKNVKYSMVINTLSFKYNEKKDQAYTNTQIIRSLIEASKKGVKIDLVTNGVDAGFGEAGFQLRKLGDKLRMSGHFVLASVLKGLENVFGTFSARSQRKNLIHALGPTEAKMWMYFNHIHSKQMNFDQIMTSTGSFNLDSYSYRNHESTMICLDKKLSDESMVGFVSDIVNSTPVFSK
jgi:phosphatidylserine/phosphatidylglycerophosphate/cardiolipin synthase-like enzyme